MKSFAEIYLISGHSLLRPLTFVDSLHISLPDSPNQVTSSLMHPIQLEGTSVQPPPHFSLLLPLLPLPPPSPQLLLLPFRLRPVSLLLASMSDRKPYSNPCPRMLN